jgi:amino acid permease
MCFAPLVNTADFGLTNLFQVMIPEIPHEQYEKARKYTRKKRRLYWHFVVFLVGSVLLIVLNTILNLGQEYGNWFVWVILFWFFLWLLHFVNVFVFSRFFDKDWERRETEKLLAKHDKKVEKLERRLINEGIISPSEKSKKKETP